MHDDLVLVSIGNTRTRLATVRDDGLDPSQVLSNDDPAAVARAIAAAGKTAVIASVNERVCDRIEAELAATGPSIRVLRFGRDLAIPVAHTLDEQAARTLGQDRLLDALGAFARSEQACVVIDAGTAVTVDFVDGEGVFHGGVIAPGVQMMLRSLHEQTSALPLVAISRDLLPASDPDAPDKRPPFGRDTSEAIARGVAGAIRGLAHDLIDRYAEFYGAYPRIIATGGDAPLLFENDPLVEAVVPDLTLIGMLEAVKRLDRLAESDGAEEDR
jgi:type III pantothenate kinase